MGNSRPASGSEHHLSHYFEVVGLLRNEDYFCHGVDVAYSTYITALLRKELIGMLTPSENTFNEAEWEKEISRVYGGGVTSDGIIALQKKLGWIYESKTETYKQKWNAIRSILLDSPSPEEVLEMLESVELSLDDFDKTYSKDKQLEAIRYAKYLKDRYTVLWLYDQVVRQ